MDGDGESTERLAALRRRAEAQFDRAVEGRPDMSPDELGRLLHELRTYQVELELQNEDLRRAQEELVESRDRYSDLYDFAPVGYLTLDEKASILESNLTASDILGVERSRLSKRPLAEFVESEDQDDFFLFRRRLLESRERTAADFRVKAPGGELRWVRLECVPVEVAEQDGIRFRAVLSNVTEHRAAEAHRRELERCVLQSQKLESLGVLAGGIAHDFNNLLTGVLGMAGLAMLEIEPESPVTRFLQEIERSARRAEALCRQMLAFAGRGRLSLEAVDITAVVRETTHLLRTSIPKSVRLELELAPDLPAVEADASQIGQVVMNLVLNATESLPEGDGEIRVSTRAVDPKALGQDPSSARAVQLVISDSGCGMDEETRERIFEPFFTTKFAGRGLGLAAVKGIVAAHSGEIRVTNTDGPGTTFTLLFPATSRQVEPRPEKTEPIVGSVQGTVLVVDDEAAIRDLATRSLQRAGARVLTAADGLEALETYQQYLEEIDLVLLDLTMPRLGGDRVLDEMRRLRPDVRVILTSGFTEHDVMSRFPGLRTAMFLQKPYMPGELVARACKVLTVR